MVKNMGKFVKWVFIVNAITSFVFGLGFIFMPEISLSSFGITTTDYLGYRMFGVILFSNWILLFFARNSDDSDARKAIFIFELGGLVFLNTLMLILMDLTNLMVWFSLILQFIYAALYAYFLFKKEKI